MRHPVYLQIFWSCTEDQSWIPWRSEWGNVRASWGDSRYRRYGMTSWARHTWLGRTKCKLSWMSATAKWSVLPVAIRH